MSFFLEKFNELQATVNDIAPLTAGNWRLSVTGVDNDFKYGLTPTSDRRPLVHK
jgi:hypothetical protein